MLLAATERSFFLAKVFGFYFLAGGAVLVFRPDFVRQMTADFMRLPGLVYFAGQVMFVVGLLLVLSHSIWELSWVGLITVFGWVILLKVLSLLFMSEGATKELGGLEKKAYFNYISGVVVMALGVFLVLEGYDWI